jgi:hypothetical protein
VIETGDPGGVEVLTEALDVEGLPVGDEVTTGGGVVEVPSVCGVVTLPWPWWLSPLLHAAAAITTAVASPAKAVVRRRRVICSPG